MPRGLQELMPEPARHSTGLPRLDEMLGGGLLPGTLTVVVGATGIGKTQLGVQFADAGARQEGRPRHPLRHELAGRYSGARCGLRAGFVPGNSRRPIPRNRPMRPACSTSTLRCADYLRVFDYSGRRVTRGDLDFDTWQGWQAELARKLAVTIAFFYGNFVAGSRRAVVDGVEPTDKPSDSIQFELFEYIYHQIVRKDADWVARDLLREHFRQFSDQVAAHMYDSGLVSCRCCTRRPKPCSIN